MYHQQIQNEIQEINNVPQAISNEEDRVSVLSPPLISQSASVHLEPEETSISDSPRRLFTEASRWNASRRSTREPDEELHGGSIVVVPWPSLPEPEENSIFAPPLPET